MNPSDSAVPGQSAGKPVMSEVLREDLRQMVEAKGGRRSPWFAQALVKTLLYPRIRAVVYFRLSQVLARRHLVALAYALQARAIRSSGAEISPFADIGPGLCLAHSVGIVVGPEVTAGRNLRLYQGVTLGEGSRPGQPVIGDDVTIGAGAALLGGIRVGHRALVGANAVVTADVPADSTAMGIPAVSHLRKNSVT